MSEEVEIIRLPKPSYSGEEHRVTEDNGTKRMFRAGMYNDKLQWREFVTRVEVLDHEGNVPPKWSREEAFGK